MERNDERNDDFGLAFDQLGQNAHFDQFFDKELFF